ncbi:piggyBac transposable element-derived protein 4-like isoform X1 [Dermacentor albipictus]|uniref:piggyBac transposable element-derived protein 4-like isoform X1 n=1 Tax=Dermacentor albipictus TaxID=60249 RepID=UPI0031FBCE2E
MGTRDGASVTAPAETTLQVCAGCMAGDNGGHHTYVSDVPPDTVAAPNVLPKRCPCGQLIDMDASAQAAGWKVRREVSIQCSLPRKVHREVSIQCSLRQMPPLPLPIEICSEDTQSELKTRMTASGSGVQDLKHCRSCDSNASAVDLIDDSNSSESEDANFSSDFDSESDDNRNQPGTSVAATRVYTSFGQDSLPSAQQRVVFSPARKPGIHFGMQFRRGTRRLLKAIDAFRLFFTVEVIAKICRNTNKYAWSMILEKPTYSEADGSWKEVTRTEMMTFIGVLLYMGIVELPRLHLYWGTSSLFSGLVLAKKMSRKRFWALLGMLQVSDPNIDMQGTETEFDKVSWLLHHINERSAEFFQPHRELSVDEKVLKLNGHSEMRQYIRDNVTKWGFKLWVLTDSKTGYTIQFIVHTGKHEKPSANGLAYDVITCLCKLYLDQGYCLYMDNFYTSTSLFRQLLARMTLACGTTRKDRHGFPKELKDTSWENKAKRGDVRWLRDSGVLYLQWKDQHVMHMVSTAHTANQHVLAKRREKRDGKWHEISIKKPQLVDEYNAVMRGVDKSDQLTGSCNILQKCFRRWKTLFLLCMDIACVNSYIIFQEYRKLHPEIAECARIAGYDQLAFRTELVQQLLELEYSPQDCAPPPSEVIQHQPAKTEKFRNCKKCYSDSKIEHKTRVYCKTCNVPLCFTSRNCFAAWHAQL